jgi:hypothetical protein
MSRDRYASKARQEARISGQTYRGRRMDPTRAITRLVAASRNDLAEGFTPADLVRSDAEFARARLAGEVATIATLEESAKGKGVVPDVIRRQGLI